MSMQTHLPFLVFCMGFFLRHLGKLERGVLVLDCLGWFSVWGGEEMVVVSSGGWLGGRPDGLDSCRICYAMLFDDVVCNRSMLDALNLSFSCSTAYPKTSPHHSFQALY